MRSAAATRTQDAPERCAIYIRVSTAMQRMEGWSLDAQRASLSAFAKAQGWKVVEIYADEGKSARKRLKDRKAIHQLLQDVKAGKIDVILFKELDRWFRNVADFYRVQEILDAADVRWVSERQPTLDMSTKEGRLNVNVLLSVGQNEADSTSDRIKYTAKFLRSQKRWTSGPSNLPKGYTLDENQHVIIDPESEAWTRALIDAVQRTGAVRAALREANAATGAAYRYDTAAGVLKNEMLCGRYKEVPDFVARPYLSAEAFQEIQKKIRRRTYTSKEFYIFSGLLKCGACGHVMSGTTSHKNGKIYRYYICNDYRKEQRCSNKKRINEEKLEAELLDRVQEAAEARIITIKAAHKVQRPKRKDNNAAIDKKIERLNDLYISGDISRKQYDAKREKLESERTTQTEDDDTQQIKNLERIRDLFVAGFRDVYAELDQEEKKQFWRRIIRVIVINNAELQAVDFEE